jgi:hypothetical protein
MANEMQASDILYRGVDKSLARPTSRCIFFDGENISFNASLVMYINSTNIPPIMIINRIYGNQNLLSLYLVSFLVWLRTYQHLCINRSYSRNDPNVFLKHAKLNATHLMHKPKGTINKMPLVANNTNINLLHVSALVCHPWGLFQIRRIQCQHSNLCMLHN